MSWWQWIIMLVCFELILWPLLYKHILAIIHQLTRG